MPRRRRRTRCAACGSESPTRRCGRTSGCSSSSTGRRCRAAGTRSPLLDGIVDAWVEPLAEIAVAQGRPEARPAPRRGSASPSTRGLLLDLLATGDREAVDAAMERYIAAFS